MKQLNKPDFRKLAVVRFDAAIEGTAELKNLAHAYWVYDGLLSPLQSNGWVRFAAGFKAGLYAHREHKWCIKLMGMGVGDNPLYFAERGYYLDHERRMLQAFRDRGFFFGPAVMSQDESITFLTNTCGVPIDQATARCRNNDLIVIERIQGVPFASQTGHFLNYIPQIAVFNSSVVQEAERALRQLRSQLLAANTAGLLHNDPMPANILFSLDENDELSARLVDFELAQDLRTSAPEYVSSSVQELYADRDVPRNSHNGQYIKNLDQHVIDGSLAALHEICISIRDLEASRSQSDWISVGISVLPGLSFSINIGKAVAYLRQKLE